jgi:hypothetical protein
MSSTEDEQSNAELEDEAREDVFKLLTVMPYLPDEERLHLVQLIQEYVAQLPDSAVVASTEEGGDPFHLHAAARNLIASWDSAFQSNPSPEESSSEGRRNADSRAELNRQLMASRTKRDELRQEVREARENLRRLVATHSSG